MSIITFRGVDYLAVYLRDYLFITWNDAFSGIKRSVKIKY